MTEYTPANGFTVTIPALSESANIVTAFSDYHTDIDAHLASLLKKSSGSSQTVSSPLVLSGAVTISGSSISISATTVTISSAASFGSTLTATGQIIANGGIRADIYATDGTTKTLESGTGGNFSLTNAAVQAQAKDASFSGISEIARAAVIYKSTGADYSTPTSFRRIFVGATQPTGPTLQAGDIWMW
jgi:spore coat protein U-like protein